MVKQSVEKGRRDDGIAEDVAPLGEAAVRGEDHRALFVPGVDELEEEIAAAGRDREVADLVDDEQRKAAVVADPLAKGAVAFGLGERDDDVGERAEVDAAAGFDRLDAEGEAQMSLAGSGWTYEMERFGAVDELQPGERQDAVPVERGLEGEVEPGEGLDRREPRHLDRHPDAPVLARGQLFGKQGVDGFDGADLAALDAAQRHIEDFQRPRHLQGDERGLDALDDGRRAHRTPPRPARRRPTAA